MNISQAIRELPKAELHIHLLGAIRPKTLLSLIQDENPDSDYRTLEDITRLFQFRTFRHFILTYTEVVDYVTQEKHLEQIAFDMLEDCANCNTRYVEASFSAIDHIQRGLGYEKMLNAINRGIRRAKRRFGIECNIRIDLVRNEGPAGAMRILDLIESKSDNVISVDIGGSEDLYPPKPFAKAFRRARRLGLHTVAHAGEAAGPESVWEAIKHLNIERVGHAVSAARDNRLLDYIKSKRIGIEACPISNVRTGAVKSLQEHPIREFYNRGLLVTLNSDDPTFFQTDLNNEYLQLNKRLGFSILDLFQLSVNAIEVSFLSEKKKARMRDSFTKEAELIFDAVET
ncbi:MAG: adenosine deaminase [Candidatus Thorarchaeota archaeon]